ncbi:unnamed protein product [Cunninghamella blakesleeana]
MSRIGQYMDEDYESAVREANEEREWVGRALYNKGDDRFCKILGIILASFIVTGLLVLAIFFIYPAKNTRINDILVYLKKELPSIYNSKH